MSDFLIFAPSFPSPTHARPKHHLLNHAPRSSVSDFSPFSPIVSHQRPRPVCSHQPLHTAHVLAYRFDLVSLFLSCAPRVLNRQRRTQGPSLAERAAGSRTFRERALGPRRREGVEQQKMGEHVAWTHGQDGCSAVAADGASDIRSVVTCRRSLAYSHNNSSNLTFPLEPDWPFVETED